MSKKQIKKASEELHRYLVAWHKEDFETLYNHCTYTWQDDNQGIGPGVLHLWFQDHKLESYRIVSAKKTGQAAMDFVVSATLSGQKSIAGRIRLICEAGAYAPTLRGRWGVNPLSILRLLTKPK